MMDGLETRIEKAEKALAITPAPEGAVYFKLRVQEGYGYHGTMIVPANNEEEAKAEYWLRRSMQNPAMPLEITESTAEAYAEQLEARLRLAVTGV